jgi:hypothetical protein
MSEECPRSRAAARVLELERQRYRAMSAADIAELDRLLADTLRYTHSDASTDDKAAYLRQVADGTYSYGEIALTEEAVLDLGTTALIFGVMEADAVVYGTPRRVRNLGVSVWTERSGAWQLTAYQPTPLPKQAS